MPLHSTPSALVHSRLQAPPAATETLPADACPCSLFSDVSINIANYRFLSLDSGISAIIANYRTLRDRYSAIFRIAI